MEPKVEVIGVYAVSEEMWTHNQPVYLIELQFRGATPFDAGALAQEMPGKPEDSWQVAYDERELDVSGEREIDERSLSYEYEGDVRLAFFLHLIDFERPLLTPFGDVSLPPPTDVPERLAWLEYEPSD
jgi:hypothetical protein